MFGNGTCAAAVVATQFCCYRQRQEMSMKSLPRSPMPGTATTLTATMMARAFQSSTSHQKRGLAEMMAPPPTPTAQTSSSSCLDCQSLQSSLKRVRLSSSPGELRLQRDLRHLETSSTTGSWQRVRDEASDHDVWVWHPPAPPVSVRSLSKTAAGPRHPQIELRQLESLRLRLTYDNSVVVWIQVPRMYPHKPPIISRIVYNNNNHTTAQLQQQQHSKEIQNILVQEAPPMRAAGEEKSATAASTAQLHQQTPGSEISSSSASSPDNNQENLAYHLSNNGFHDANTVVYHNWSPVQRLGNVLEFVISVLEQQQRQQDNNHCNLPLTYSSSSLSSTAPIDRAFSSSSASWSRRNSSSSIGSTSHGGGIEGFFQPRSSFPTAEERKTCHQEEDMMMGIARDEDGQPLGEEFLNPKRFDVGYDREKPPITMDMDVHSHVQYQCPDTNTMMMMEDL